MMMDVMMMERGQAWNIRNGNEGDAEEILTPPEDRLRRGGKR